MNIYKSAGFGDPHQAIAEISGQTTGYDHTRLIALVRHSNGICDELRSVNCEL